MISFSRTASLKAMVGVLGAGFLIWLAWHPADVPQVLRTFDSDLGPPEGADIRDRTLPLVHTRLVNGVSFTSSSSCEALANHYGRAWASRGFGPPSVGRAYSGGRKIVWTKGKLCAVLECCEGSTGGVFLAYVAWGSFGSSVCRASE